MPLVYPLALTDLHFSVFALGLMVATANLAGGFLQLGAGAVIRVIRRHTLLGLGAFGMAVAALISGTSTSFLQFSAGNILQSVATSPQHPIGNSLLSDVYAKAKRGTAIAGHIAGGNVGTVVLTPAAAILLNAFGWRTAVLLLTIPAMLAGGAGLRALGGTAGAPRGGPPFPRLTEG